MAEALDFDSFYQEVLKERLRPLERRRQLRLWSLRLLPLVLLVLVSTVYAFQWMRVLVWWEFFLISALIGVVVIAVFWFFFAERNLPHDVEMVLQDSLPEFLGAEFKTKPGLVHYKKFVASQLFKQRTQHYDGENHYEGEMPLAKIEFSELRAGGPVQSGWHDVFWGLFFYAELMMQPFNTPILIVPNRVRQGFAHTGDAILAHQYNEQEDELVRIDTQVNNHYAVYAGEDKIARDLLSKPFIETLNTLGKSYPARVALRNGEVYVAIHLGHNWLQPDLDGSILNPNRIRHYYEVAALGIKLCKAASQTGGGMNPMANLPDLSDV